MGTLLIFNAHLYEWSEYFSKLCEQSFVTPCPHHSSSLHTFSCDSLSFTFHVPAVRISASVPPISTAAAPSSSTVTTILFRVFRFIFFPFFFFLFFSSGSQSSSAPAVREAQLSSAQSGSCFFSGARVLDLDCFSGSAVIWIFGECGSSWQGSDEEIKTESGDESEVATARRRPREGGVVSDCRWREGREARGREEDGKSCNTAGPVGKTSGSIFEPEGGHAPEVTGSPTEKAILSWGLQLGMKFSETRSKSSILQVFPFNSEKKRGEVVVQVSYSKWKKCFVIWVVASFLAPPPPPPESSSPLAAPAEVDGEVAAMVDLSPELSVDGTAGPVFDQIRAG
ncbi:P-type ATPase [Hordeum vulgare]|nr:P-type ATPase [Hordeum vulgare]